MAAGNHIATAVRDILQQLVINNNLCIVKINPCNDWIGPALGTIFEPLVNAGALRIVYGNAAVAQVRFPPQSCDSLESTGVPDSQILVKSEASGSSRCWHIATWRYFVRLQAVIFFPVATKAAGMILSMLLSMTNVSASPITCIDIGRVCALRDVCMQSQLVMTLIHSCMPTPASSFMGLPNFCTYICPFVP